MAGFQDIYGQEAMKEHLQNAIRLGKVSHAYIINGERNSGKEFIARIFARTLQCERGGIEPCGECHSCKQAESGNQPDIIRVTHEKPNSIGVEDIRSQVNNDIVIKPYSSPYKIYIINEGEKMTVQAQNALLKTLEELGVKPIEAVGQPFDPNFHNAVMHIEDESLGENVVAEEFQKGYLYRDSVVRHSMVKVAN